ncbi:hypothetical protein PFLA_a0843 [Pseudoalteromonas flavipulchra NCIMB 2033 = ATCC BAA-314]|nr:hypothetical protein [Pseudoalteromonas flavipulchra NCIMB 2033 = ATCC BAA-314]
MSAAGYGFHQRKSMLMFSPYLGKTLTTNFVRIKNVIFN